MLFRKNDVLDVILELETEDRRREASVASSAQATFRSVANAGVVEAAIQNGLEIMYNNETYAVSPHPSLAIRLILGLTTYFD